MKVFVFNKKTLAYGITVTVVAIALIVTVVNLLMM